MRNIKKELEPTSLLAHRRTPGADWNGYKEKAEAFAALCREQGYICAYCMRRIKPQRALRRNNPDQTPREDEPYRAPYNIEHWIARSHGPESPHAAAVHKEHEMKWSNLLGVCPGDLEAGSRITAASPGVKNVKRQAAIQCSERSRHCCDRSRGKKPLHIHPALETRPLGELFRYHKDGRIWSQDENATRDLESLNLNAWRLKEGRQRVFERIREALPRGEQWTQSKLRRELKKWQTRTEHIRWSAPVSGEQTDLGFRQYCQVAISYLEKKIKQCSG